MNSIKPIHNETVYEHALDRVDELMELNFELDVSESDELEALALHIEEYEESAWVISKLNYIEDSKTYIKKIVME